jgi:hypothetical protein
LLKACLARETKRRGEFPRAKAQSSPSSEKGYSLSELRVPLDVAQDMLGGKETKILCGLLKDLRAGAVEYEVSI